MNPRHFQRRSILFLMTLYLIGLTAVLAALYLMSIRLQSPLRANTPWEELLDVPEEPLIPSRRRGWAGHRLTHPSAGNFGDVHSHNRSSLGAQEHL